MSTTTTTAAATTAANSPDSGFSILTTSRSGDIGSRKAGLLRLFKSELFDSSMAMTYLWKYNRKEVGIQHSICDRLRSVTTQKVEFLLPQLCHLVVCNPDESPALEYLLLEHCQRSIHGAIFCLWYLENYISDFRTTFVKSANLYLRSVRLLSELQKLVFRDHVGLSGLSQSWSSDDEETATGAGQSTIARIKTELAASDLPRISACIAAAGSALAGIGNPTFTSIVKPMILIEAKRQSFGRLKTRKLPIRHSSDPKIRAAPFNSMVPSVEELHSGSAFSFRDYVIKAAKQMQVNAPKFMMLTGSESGTLGLSEAELSRGIPPPVPLFYFAEMQFVLSLVDVSNRLVSVSREGRLKALKAELTLINHNLPATLCLPLWCQGSPHHRILRISPTDAVVLNSAERAPFLVQLEVLEGDLTGEQFEELLSSCSENVKGIQKVPSQVQLDSVPPKADSTDDLPPNGTIQSGHVNSISEPNIPFPPLRTYEPETNELAPLSADDFSDRMRTAAIMLAQLTRQASQPNCSTQALSDITAIKSKIIKEMEMLEKNRLLDAIQQQDSPRGGQDVLFLDNEPVIDRDDPSAAVFQEGWEEKQKRIRSASPYGTLENWKLLSVIVKSGSDMRQEQLACQIISEMTNIWNGANLPLWTYCYRVLVASSNGGLVETVPNAISLHSLKKNAYLKNFGSNTFIFSLRDHFIKCFGSPDSDSFQKARSNFAESLAAYSIVTYLLQVKDRHDGNILLDNEGHLIHIDFGFMLSNSPGYVGFESAPFKLSPEYIELLGGLHSPEFAKFKDLIFLGFLELRKHVDRIVILVEIMQIESRLPCFYSGDAAIAHLRQRFHLTLTDTQLRQVVDRLVISSAYNIFTKLYDTFQYYSNGIL